MRGEITVRVRCLMPEKLIDRATVQGAHFDEVRLVGENTLVVCCGAASARQLLALCRRFGLDAAVTGRRGGSALRRFIERRATLAAGIAVAVALCTLFLTRLWIVDIAFTGERASLGDTAALSQSLDALGIHPGMARDIDTGLIAQQLLATNRRYSYVGARLQGVRLLVEAVPEVPAPALYDVDAARDLVCARDGIVVSAIVRSGALCVKPGDAVRRGQVLIRGEEQATQEETRPIAALGEVVVRSWFTGEARLPLTQASTVDTGQRSTGAKLTVLGLEWPGAGIPAHRRAVPAAGDRAGHERGNPSAGNGDSRGHPAGKGQGAGPGRRPGDPAPDGADPIHPRPKLGGLQQYRHFAGREGRHRDTIRRRGDAGGITGRLSNLENMEQSHTEHMSVESPEQFIGMFGIREENIPLFREELGVEIYAHGSEITLSGDPDKVALARETLEKLGEIVLRGETVDRTRIRYAIGLAAEGKADRIGEIMRDVIAITYRGRQVKCKTLGQKQYVDAIKNNTATFAVGPAGTGKTYLAIAMAVVALKNKEIEKIILTRPAVEAGEKLGFLPGDLAQKVDPYLRPLYDALHEMLGLDAYQRLLERGAVEVAPLAYMRGRTLNDAFIILDEAQNTTSEQMKMFLTRMGMGSKMVITGDITQIDLPTGKKSGLVEALEVLRGVDDIGIVQLSHRDVVRHELVQAIVRAYEKHAAKDERADRGRRYFRP